MRDKSTHRVAAATALALGLASLAAQAQARTRIELPAQPLAESLRAIGTLTNTNVLFDPPLVAGQHAPAIAADLTAEEALDQALAGTRIGHEFLNDTTVVLSSDARESSLWQPLRIAQTDIPNDGQPPQAKPQTAESAAHPARDSERIIQEVIVTAQKRQEGLLEVPVPVAAISGRQLRDSGKTQLADYFAEVPSLSYVSDGFSKQVTIRGLSSGFGFSNPTVGFTIDDVPYGSARSDGGAYTLPEIDPGDLASVEVLRGPQGTLYGASSLGGLIKYVTIDPSFDGVHGHVSAGVNTIENGAGAGYNGHAAINLPVGDALAIRASGYSRKSAGFIDNPVRGLEGLAERRIAGGRLAALWAPSDIFSMKLSGFYEDVKQNGMAQFSALLGDLQQNDLPGTGVDENKQHGYAATLRLQLGVAELMSITGYNVIGIRNYTDAQRGNESIIANTENIFGPAVPNNSTVLTSDWHHDLKKLSQEFRLSLPLGTRVDGQFGLFYADEDYRGNFEHQFRNSATMRLVAINDTAIPIFDYTERAAFANLTFRMTDKFDTQVGGRYSHSEQTYQPLNLGPAIDGVALGPPNIGAKFPQRENVATYQVTPRYRFTDALMVYARIATGYRPGGFNAYSPNDVPVPLPPYDSDRSTNYEMGFKGTLLDGALTVDASVYRIDWDDIQISLTAPGGVVSMTANGGAALSQGVELSVSVQPLAGLTLSGWIAVNDAKLAEDFPAGATAVGKKGDRLPLAGELSGSFSATQEFPLAQGKTFSVGGTVTYVDNSPGNFSEPDFFTGIVPPRGYSQGYTTVELDAAIRNDVWAVNFYATNITDERGITVGNQGDLHFPITPREIGLSISRSF